MKPARGHYLSPSRRVREKLENVANRVRAHDRRRATLRNWEQGRRIPDGPALALCVSQRAIPQAVALHRESRKGAA